MLNLKLKMRKKEEMSLKCPICGREYYYDRKICQECEDYSNYSDLIEFKGKNKNRWNCAIFLNSNNFVFGLKKSSKSKVKFNSEFSNLRANEREFYNRIYNSPIEFNDYSNNHIKNTEFKLDSTSIVDKFNKIKKEVNLSLIYE